MDLFYDSMIKESRESWQLVRELRTRLNEADALVRESLDCMCENEIPYSDYVKGLHQRIESFLRGNDDESLTVPNTKPCPECLVEQELTTLRAKIADLESACKEMVSQAEARGLRIGEWHGKWREEIPPEARNELNDIFTSDSASNETGG
jgi:hypothetical protein